ncbi:Uncharacterised protein [Burkholderia pseudomallei]|uniref:hypothetical protein n=1 Tax=Burkholderia thailandensis TaxID=57975 RepID=UPI0013771F8F|nr:hypothetical protein [Burkholderia thailandensis]NBD04858.1 hypothetical protein [Burkholderia thailandensis]CAJ3418799.1 Uncharacterised protein [Burkholderia pseudomallei]CAJ9746530.1 Uncharacterised protein [Burkholderia pseudomallei]
MKAQPAAWQQQDSDVWGHLEDAKKLYDSYLQINSTASPLSALTPSVTHEIEIKEDFPPLTLALYR